MGDLQHFCLRWNNYQNSITTAFENLRDDEDFIDVTLACDGKTLKAHRVVLSACSPYFRELLKSTPCKHPVIVLQDVVFDDLYALVEFIYHGEVNVHQRNLTSFLKTAEVLKVSGLTQHNAGATPVPTASPFSDHCNENIPARFTTRSPSTPPDKEGSFPQPFFNSSHPRTNNSNEDRNSPRAVQQQTRQRRHIRSPTPIRSSYTRDESPVPLKRAKSADNPSPSLIGSSINISPATVLNDNLVHARTRRNSCDDSSSSRRNSPNTFSNDNYDENHNDEDPVAPGDREDDEPPVDFSTNAIKKYLNQPGQYPPSKSLSPRNLSMKIEPMDLVSNHNNNNNLSSSNNNNNNNNNTNSNNNSSSSTGSSNNNNENDNNFNDEDSNQSEDRLSNQSPLPTNPFPPVLLDHDDAFAPRNFLDPKLFASAGASFSFNVAAAALAADSLAGFNHHQSHTNAGPNLSLDTLSGPSQGRSFNGSMVCADWMELERRGGNQGQNAIGGGQQQHGCFICGKMLSTRLTLKRHIEQQHHQPLHSSVCTICHKVFRTLNSLNNHKSIYHRKPKWSTTTPAINS